VRAGCAVLAFCAPPAAISSSNACRGTRMQRGESLTVGMVPETLHQPTPEQIKAGISLLEACDKWSEVRDVQLSWGHINYTVWSDVFVCPNCTREVVFWLEAVDRKSGHIYDEFPCPYCKVLLTKHSMDRSWVTTFDSAIGQTSRHAKQIPVLINYSIGKKRYEKAPDVFDMRLMEKIDNVVIPHWFPSNQIPNGHNTEQPRSSHGVTHIHHFYTRRDFIVLSSFHENVVQEPFHIRTMLNTVLTSLLFYSSKLSCWRLGNRSGPLSGTLYISSTVMPLDALTILPNRIRRMSEAKRMPYHIEETAIDTVSATDLHHCPDDSIDYIFTDPPFGGNLMYSELNFVWESLAEGVYQDTSPNAPGRWCPWYWPTQPESGRPAHGRSRLSWSGNQRRCAT
jgi:hypothetical protein